MTPRDISPKQADLLSLKVDYEHRRRELQLMQSRWWDYRLLHPTVTTYLYADLYNEAHREWWRRYIDVNDADRPELWTDIFASRDLTSVWLARQSADSFGIPYEFVMEFMIQRSLSRQFRHVMRPNQLYGEEFEIDLLAAWELKLSESLRTARAPFYQAAAYTGHPIQNRYRSWLINRIRSRPKPHFRILARLLNEGHISPGFVEGEWGPKELAEAETYRRVLNI